MASAERHHQRKYGSLLSKLSASGHSDEELDANDLEVAMINESFEEQVKHSLLFTQSNLKSVFYGAPTADVAATQIPMNKQSPDLGIDDEAIDFKMDVTPPLQFLPNISPPLDSDKEELERGHQLDKELERMMLDGEEPFAGSPLLCPNFGAPSLFSNLQFITSGNDTQLPTFFSDEANNLFASFDSHLDPDESQQYASECADAAEAIAYDVVSSLFADEHKNSADFFSDDEESMVINASILNVLEDDEAAVESECDAIEDDDPKLGKSGGESKCGGAYVEKDDRQVSPPSRNDSMRTIASPTSDEQTVPVIDSWEQLEDSPSAAEKVYSEAKAVLRKLRAERKATQL